PKARVRRRRTSGRGLGEPGGSPNNPRSSPAKRAPPPPPPPPPTPPRSPPPHPARIPRAAPPTSADRPRRRPRHLGGHPRRVRLLRARRRGRARRDRVRVRRARGVLHLPARPPARRRRAGRLGDTGSGRAPARLVGEREEEQPRELFADLAHQTLVAPRRLFFEGVQRLALREEKLVSA